MFICVGVLRRKPFELRFEDDVLTSNDDALLEWLQLRALSAVGVGPPGGPYRNGLDVLTWDESAWIFLDTVFTSIRAKYEFEFEDMSELPPIPKGAVA